MEESNAALKDEEIEEAEVEEVVEPDDWEMMSWNELVSATHGIVIDASDEDRRDRKEAINGQDRSALLGIARALAASKPEAD